MGAKIDKNPQYFEGKLQLRNPTQEIIDFVASEIESRSDAWIAKTEKQKRGIDVYLSSNKVLKGLGRKLKAKFTGELIESSKLFSVNRQTSKEVYRGCIMFKFYDINKGDVITYRGDSLKVIGLGKEILCHDVQTGKKVHLKYGDLR